MNDSEQFDKVLSAIGELKTRMERMETRQDLLAETTATILVEQRAFRADVDMRFGDVNKRFGEVDRRFGEVNKRFDTVERRIERVYTRVEDVETAVKELKTDVAGLKRRFH